MAIIDEIRSRLVAYTPPKVAYPPCTDVLLGLIASQDDPIRDDVEIFFSDYFSYPNPPPVIDLRHRVALQFQNTLDDLTTLDGETPLPERWPPRWCIPSYVITLSGRRLLDPSASKLIERLFIGDAVWLYYFDRLGIFQILGVILDDYATKGNIPISSGLVQTGDGDDFVALILEEMVQKTKTGLSSSVRDRTSSYRRSLGWTTDAGRKMAMETNVNTAFSNSFHRLIQLALEYYRDKRLANLIGPIQTSPGTSGPVPSRTSQATIVSIKETILLLKDSFESFKYGRNYYNTLSGIVWAIAGMSMIRKLKAELGIPNTYSRPEQYISAAYDILVLKKPLTGTDTNRYSVHRECATNARELLLHIEALTDLGNFPSDSDNLINQWIEDPNTERKFEGYRTAYKNLTGVDLGAAGTPIIEQQA